MNPQQDTARLLQECDAGIQMGLISIDEMMSTATQPLRQQLQEYRMEHEKLQQRSEQLLGEIGAQGKDPGAMAKGMSFLKTNMKLSMEPSNASIAGLMTDGCNMGIKSLNRYLNRYAQADGGSKRLAKSLIDLEQRMIDEMKPML